MWLGAKVEEDERVVVAEQPGYSAGRVVDVGGGGMSVLHQQGHCEPDCVLSGYVMLLPPLSDPFVAGLVSTSLGRPRTVERSRFDTNPWEKLLRRPGQFRWSGSV